MTTNITNLVVDLLFFLHFSQYRSDSESQNDLRAPLCCCPEYLGAEVADGLTSGSGIAATRVRTRTIVELEERRR